MNKEKVLVGTNGNYILFRNVLEIRLASGDKNHDVEVRLIGETTFTPVEGKMSDIRSAIVVVESHE